MPAPEDRGPIHGEGFLVGDLIGKLDEEFRKMRKEKCPDCAGGYFSFCDGYTGAVYVTAKLGDPPHGKIDKHMRLSAEKAQRLAMNSGHRASRQSRDPDLEQFGGAIRAQAPKINGEMHPVILSFSGFPKESDDEYLMFALAVRLEMLSQKEADWIASLEPAAEKLAAA